jgi:hypothetical protein
VSYSEYEKDGVKKYSTDIIVEPFGIELLGDSKKPEGAGEPADDWK